MANALDDKVTELAAAAVKKPDSWTTVIVLALWCWWISYQLTVATKKLQEEKLAASKAALDAMDAANVAKVKALQLDIDAAATEAAQAVHQYQMVIQRIDGKLADAENAKQRVTKLKNWEDLDALAQGR